MIFDKLPGLELRHKVYIGSVLSGVPHAGGSFALAACPGVIARFDPGLDLEGWRNLGPRALVYLDGCFALAPEAGSDAEGCFCVGLDLCLDPLACFDLGLYTEGCLDLCLVLGGFPVLMLLLCLDCSVVSTQECTYTKTM